MQGNFSSILPDHIGEESEAILTELLERKVTGAAGLAVELLHAMEKAFGKKARDVMMDLVRNREKEPRDNPEDPKTDLRTFCGNLDRGCIGSHRWERIQETENKVAYRFTDCLWARVFRTLGEPDLGFYYCAGDEPSVRSYNPALGFRRTQVLMKGDEICDHVFYVSENTSNG